MKGECTVAAFLPNLDYIKMKKGEDGVRTILDEMKKRGYDYDIPNMKKMALIPLEARKEFFQILKDLFEWDDGRIADMGMNSVKLSFIMRNFIGLFLSMDRVYDMGPEIWRKHYTTGELKKVRYEDGLGVLKIIDFDIDPMLCTYLTGYFTGMGRLAKKTNVKTVEKKCTFKGDEWHEFHTTWDV